MLPGWTSPARPGPRRGSLLYLGNASYSIYLFPQSGHVNGRAPAQPLVQSHGLPVNAACLLMCVLATAAGCAVHTGLERPLLSAPAQPADAAGRLSRLFPYGKFRLLPQMPAAELKPLAAPFAAQPAPGLRHPAGEAWLAFLVGGATNPFTVRLVGLMPVSEVRACAAAGAVGAACRWRSRIGSPVPLVTRAGPSRILLACQAVALFGYAISDFWAGRHALGHRAGLGADDLPGVRRGVPGGALRAPATTFVLLPDRASSFSGLHVFDAMARFCRRPVEIWLRRAR